MLLLSAFFSGMEIAFLSKNRLREEIDRKQSPLFNHIADLFSRNAGNYITTILVGNNIALVVYSMFMSILLQYFFSWSNELFETIVSTVVILFMGEYIPKSVVRRSPNFYYSVFAPVIYIIYILLYPITRFSTLLSYGLLRLTGSRVEQRREPTEFNRDDLASLVEDENVEVQSEEEEDIRLFQNALDFADLRVRDCMVQRIDVEAVDLETTTIQELTERFVETKFSRIFVWHDSIDNIIGYIHSSEMFHEPADWRQCIRQLPIVPETMSANKLMKLFMQQKKSLAAVVDEFGGTSGIVTMEDIIEEIVGEINDEYDEEERSYVKINDRTYVFEAKTLLSDFYKIVKVDTDSFEDIEGDADTLAGLLLEIKGEFPKLHEKLEYDRFQFEVLEMDARRILKIKVILGDPIK